VTGGHGEDLDRPGRGKKKRDAFGGTYSILLFYLSGETRTFGRGSIRPAAPSVSIGDRAPVDLPGDRRQRERESVVQKNTSNKNKKQGGGRKRRCCQKKGIPESTGYRDGGREGRRPAGLLQGGENMLEESATGLTTSFSGSK